LSEIVERLFKDQNECTLSWLTRDGNPAATTVSFVELDGQIWMTALASSARVTALSRNPNAAVVISGKGSEVGHARCVSLQGRCEVGSDPASRDRFFPAFSRAVLPNSRAGAELMSKGMNTPENRVLVFTASKTIPYDAQAALAKADSL
jgi:hypothetical protein